jgi:flagella basal body P-ring formation protein FlgA
MVAGADICLGDIFGQVGERSGVKIAVAPPPGNQLVFDAPALQRLAHANGLAWQPLTGQERVVILRETRPIDGETIARPILGDLARRGFDTRGIDIEIPPSLQRLKRSVDSRVDLQDIRYDASGGRVNAVLEIVAPGEIPQRIPMNVKLSRSLTVPVLARPLRPGDAISPADLGWIELKDRKLPANALLDPSTMVGMTARRNVQPGMPILASDVKRPSLIAKGQLVTMIVEDHGMQLTAQGRALDAGGEGDVVRVTNLQSRAIVEGTVTRSGQVVIAAPAGQNNR